LAAAAPAALASLAYLNARTQIGSDLSMIKAMVRYSIHSKLRERKDRVNAFYLLEGHANNSKVANHPFLIYEGREWTYKETYETVLGYATLLKTKYGVVSKEIVALDCMNSPKFIFALFALWSLGAKPALINYNLSGKPLLHCVQTSTARVVLVDDEIAFKFTPDVLVELKSPTFREGAVPVELVSLDAAFDKIATGAKGVREPDSSRAGDTFLDMAVLIYTSGTTGNPKAAAVNWFKLTAGRYILESWMGLLKTDRFYTVGSSCSVFMTRSKPDLVYASLSFLGKSSLSNAIASPWVYHFTGT
jgi:acyl-CoA synthetase (AMP-forming)/AMP-acid ligase II